MQWPSNLISLLVCFEMSVRICECRSQEGFNFENREVKEAVKLLDKNGDG